MSKDKPLNIYQRIIEIMKEVAYIKKGEKLVDNQYAYVSHDYVSSVLHGQFVKHGVAMIPSVERYENVPVKTNYKGVEKISGRTEATVLVKFINIDNPSDFFEVRSVGYGLDNSDKGIGKAVSYACKYAILKTFCLETGEKDVEADQESEIVTECISNEQAYELERLFNKLNNETKDEIKNALKNRWKSPNFAEIPKESFDRIKSYMNSEVKKQEEVLNEQVG